MILICPSYISLTLFPTSSTSLIVRLYRLSCLNVDVRLQLHCLPAVCSPLLVVLRLDSHDPLSAVRCALPVDERE
jgi:hypothetical protein